PVLASTSDVIQGATMDRASVAAGLGALLLSGAATYTVAWADDFPPRKAGLWQVDMTMSGVQMPPQQMKMCIEPATDAEMYKWGKAAQRGMGENPHPTGGGRPGPGSPPRKGGETKISPRGGKNSPGPPPPPPKPPKKSPPADGGARSVDDDTECEVDRAVPRR